MSGFALMLSVVAAIFFTLGGVLMKVSSGFARLGPGAAALALFMAGAIAQTFAMKYADLGVAYVFVLGLEAVLAFGFGAAFFGETVSVPKLLGVALIIGGFALLHLGASPGTR
jgi:multidrug transporter EmrE-like cation transporter